MKNEEKKGNKIKNSNKESEFSLSKKQIKIICIFIVFFASFGLIFSIQTVEGWSNGMDVPRGGWTSYTYSKAHYGTHDWIADFALEKIIDLDLTLAAKWYDGNGIWFWTDDRIRIYLYATQGPDNGEIFYINRHGQRIDGENDKRSNHHINFDGTPDPSTGKVIDGAAGHKAADMALNAILAFRDGDCGLAAFYLGEMTHYIADVSNFFHTLKPGEPSGYKSDGPYEYGVLTRTDGRYYKTHRDKSGWDRAFREWWFKV
ncbi:MAG: hypothetical protein GF311_01665 [Candidatus Lokiarchaeota archaeon]|nr:hypothetical protein [Candidatus Lokiarchaeota archaeon]